MTRKRRSNLRTRQQASGGASLYSEKNRHSKDTHFCFIAPGAHRTQPTRIIREFGDQIGNVFGFVLDRSNRRIFLGPMTQGVRIGYGEQASFSRGSKRSSRKEKERSACQHCSRARQGGQLGSQLGSQPGSRARPAVKQPTRFHGCLMMFI